MINILIRALVLVALLGGITDARAASTINPANPSANSPLASAPVRNNFGAAYNDVNSIEGMFSGTVAPTSPLVGQQWRNNSTSPATIAVWDGSQWVTYATLDSTGHIYGLTGINLTGSINFAGGTLVGGSLQPATCLGVSYGGIGTCAAGVAAAHNIGAMALASNGADIPNVAAFLTNLGIGTAGTYPTGTSGPTVPLNNGGFTQSGNVNFTGSFEIGGVAPGTVYPKNLGVSVLDPGTGALEAVLPVQTVTGASKPFAAGDLQKKTRRSNAGSAMTDSFPASTATGLVNGARLDVANIDASATDTLTAGSGTSIAAGCASVGPGRDILFVYDLPNATWRGDANTCSTAILGQSNTYTGPINDFTASETKVAAPTNASDAATKAYADSIAAGLSVRDSVIAATSAALPTNVYANGASGVGATLTGVSLGTLTIDGQATVLGSRYLVQNEVAAANNGIYTVTTLGSGAAFYVLTRATDYNQASEIFSGTYTLALTGTANASKSFALSTTGAITVGTTALAFTQINAGQTYTASGGVALTGTNFALTTPVSAGSCTNCNITWDATGRATVYANGSVGTTVTAPVRQTVLGGATSSGLPAELQIGSGLAVNLLATATPVEIAFAYGFGSSGQVDYVGQYAADQTSFWSAVPANTTSFLSIDRAISGGALTATLTVYQPQYGPSYVAPLSFNIWNMENSGANDYGGVAGTISGSGGYSTTQVKFGAYSYKNAASSFWYSSNLPNFSTPWEINGWIYVSSLGSNQSLLTIDPSSAGGNTGYPTDWSINSSNKSVFDLGTTGSGYNIWIGTAGSVTWTTGWHFVALSWDGSTYRAFVDGVLDISASSSSAMNIAGPTSYTTSYLILGANYHFGSNSGLYFDAWQTLGYAQHVATFTNPSAAPVPAGDWFDTVNMVMKSITGAGPTFGSAIQRVYVGEELAGASTITSVTPYAYQRRYIGPWIAGLPGTGVQISANHNLGTTFFTPRLELLNTANDNGYVYGDVLTDVGADATGPVVFRKGYKSFSFATGATDAISINPATGGAAVAATQGSYSYRLTGTGGF